MPLQIKIKYEKGAKRLEKIEKGDWIDVYANEEVRLKEGQFTVISLGFACQLPEGYEAHLAPRSSTFKKWGIVETNGFGVIDESYCGDDDIWKMPVYCIEAKDSNHITTTIHKGDKIGQFRIIEKMPPVEFVEVDSLGNENRGGFGSTGSV